MSHPSRLYLFHDCQCPMRRRLAAAIQRWDRGRVVEVVDLAADDTPARFPHLELDAARQMLTIMDPGGRVSRGVEALRRLGQLFPALQRQDWTHRLPGVAAAGAARRAVPRLRPRVCIRCGETWMPSAKSSRHQRGR